MSAQISDGEERDLEIIADLRGQLGMLRKRHDAVLKYAAHDWCCAVEQWKDNNVRRPKNDTPRPYCTCGLDAILTPAAQ